MDDVLEAIVVANAPRRKHNVATDHYITVNEIAYIAVKECGLAPGQVSYEHTAGDRGWKGDVPIVRFDFAKIKALVWHCRRNSAEAVSDEMVAMLEELNAE